MSGKMPQKPGEKQKDYYALIFSISMIKAAQTRVISGKKMLLHGEHPASRGKQCKKGEKGYSFRKQALEGKLQELD